MEGSSPFRPSGRTFLVLGSTPPPTATMASGSNSGEVTYLIYNLSSNQDAVVGYGQNSAAAVNNSVVPIIGTATFSLLIARGTAQTFTLAPQLFFSATTRQGGQAELYITPGRGA